MNSCESEEFHCHKKDDYQRAEKNYVYEEKIHPEFSAASIWKIAEGVAINNCHTINSIMIHISPMSATNPTPFIFTLGTCHVLASCVFLYWHIALRTLLRLDSYSPFFKLFSLVLLTCQILMPGDDTLKAEYLLALLACDFSRLPVMCFYHHILAFGIRTELLHVATHHLLVCFKLSKLFVCGLVTHFHDEVVRDWRCATLLRALNEETLAA